VTALVEGAHYDTINPAMREILGGYSLEEARALDIDRDVYVDSKDRDRMIAILRQNRQIKGFETFFKRRDGRPVRIRLGGTLVEREDEEPYFQGYVEDLTQQNVLEQQVRQVQKLEAVGRLAGGMAHDFNNVLVVIKLSTEMMLHHITPADDFSKPLLQISKAADRAAALTRQMLAFGRQQIMQARVINVNAVVGETSHMLRRVIGEDIHLITKLSPELRNSHLDPDQLNQVIMNLAVNARDAMPNGGTLHLETSNVQLDETYCRTHPPAQAGSYVMLAVSDTGSGIDKTVLPRIFDPFFTTKEVGKGTGLGLSIVYGIVKQSGGYIWVYSELGHGTTFKVYLPTSTKPLEQPVQRAETSGRAQGQLLLVVEDELSIRNNVRDCLQQLGYKVLEAQDGKAALEVCHEHPDIQVVLTDLVMPRMGGYPLANELAERHPGMRVLFMSGYTEDTATRHDILLKGSPFLQKPFSVADLAQSVQQILAMMPPLPQAAHGADD
jgi:PAS domain S-box-containing protein